MGIMNMGPPTDLILKIKEKYKLEDFIETGTFHGDTALWAARNFRHVTTIEYSRKIYDETIIKHDKVNNIDFRHGDSRSILESFVPNLIHPAVFWLDSHWCGGDSYGEYDECPLLEEICAINLSKNTNFIFIDDARLFNSPPPRPHKISQWPSIDGIIEKLKSGNHKYHIIIFEDVIVAVPDYAKEYIAGYCQEINTRVWNEHGKSSRGSEIKNGFELILRGLKLMAKNILIKRA